MSQYFSRTALGLLLCVWLPAVTAAIAPVQPVASGAATPAALGAQIDALIGQPRFAAASWGIAVTSLDNGHMLYAHRADKLLQPASTEKLFTAALVLSTFGPDYRIPTQLRASGELRNGRLDGALILYGMGDPTLGTATSGDWADQLAAQLVARGVRLVRGDLIADDSYFAGSPYGSGWEADDLQSGFAAPVSALSVQENTLDITASPANTAGLPALLSFDPASAMPPLRSSLMTVPSGSQEDINLYRAPGGRTLYAFGSIPANASPQHFRLAVADPAQLAGDLMRAALARHGIRITGEVEVSHWPRNSKTAFPPTGVLAEIVSPPLLEILQRGLKRSQNLYLQSLWLDVGAHEQATMASSAPQPFISTEQQAAGALQQLLAQIGILPSASLVDEGTGLSRRDLVTPMAMVHVLSYLSMQPYAAQLRDALPIAGVDGTLAGRMRGAPADGNVHAKTGSMTYVHCLAGYVTSAAGERLAFAIMLNNYGPQIDAPGANSDIDAIALLLANFHGHS